MAQGAEGKAERSTSYLARNRNPKNHKKLDYRFRGKDEKGADLFNRAKNAK